MIYEARHPPIGSDQNQKKATAKEKDLENKFINFLVIFFEPVVFCSFLSHFAWLVIGR